MRRRACVEQPHPVLPHGARSPRAVRRTRSTGVRGALLVGVLATVVPLAACSDDAAPAPSPGVNQPSTSVGDPSTSATAGSDPTAASQGSDPQDDPSPSGSASRPPDPEAPATVRPAERPGSAASPSVAVEDSSRTRAAWRDGLTLRVVGTERSTTTGRGRGSLPGAPQTSFDLELVNGSERAVDVSRVVLTLTYGDSPRRLAQRVYDDGTTDFSGVVAPGARQKAVYAFVLPADRDGAALVVDLDGEHALATLDGAAR